MSQLLVRLMNHGRCPRPNSRLKFAWKDIGKASGRVSEIAKCVLAGMILSLALWTNTYLVNTSVLPPTISYDVVYNPDLAQYCVGDIYQPSHASHSVSPAVIVVHGGGWEAGSKSDGSTGAIVTKLVESGFVVFNINYRLQSEDGAFPHNLNDVNQAVDFLLENAPTYGVDPKNVALLGISAGAHLALLAAYSENRSEKGLRAVVAIAPATDLSKLKSEMILKYFPASDSNRQKLASPLEHANSAISTLLVHGTSDLVVPFEQSELLAAALTRLKKPVELFAIKRGDHNFISSPGREQDEANIEIVRFLRMQDSKTLSQANWQPSELYLQTLKFAH